MQLSRTTSYYTSDTLKTASVEYGNTERFVQLLILHWFNRIYTSDCSSVTRGAVTEGRNRSDLQQSNRLYLRASFGNHSRRNLVIGVVISSRRNYIVLFTEVTWWDQNYWLTIMCDCLPCRRGKKKEITSRPWVIVRIPTLYPIEYTLQCTLDISRSLFSKLPPNDI